MAREAGTAGGNGSGVDEALGLLRLLYGDGYTFGYDAERGWWATRDGETGPLLTAPTPVALGGLIDSEPEARTALWCTRCGQRVTVSGTDPHLGKAVHEGGGERGPDGHVAAPIGHEPALWKAAREIAADYGGAFDVDARFGVLRADWSAGVTGPGVTALHYEARDEAEMRRKLDAAVAGTRWEREQAAR